MGLRSAAGASAVSSISRPDVLQIGNYATASQRAHRSSAHKSTFYIIHEDVNLLLTQTPGIGADPSYVKDIKSRRPRSTTLLVLNVISAGIIRS